MRLKYFIMVLLTALLLAALSPPSYSDRKERNTMDFSEFAKIKKGTASFEITFDGKEVESFFSQRSYLHYESIAFFGVEGITSSYRILYHTEADLVVLCDSVRVEIAYGRIRTRLRPSYEKAFRKGGAVAKNEEAISKVLERDGVSRALLCEYGIVKGQCYYGHIKEEGYHLPPRERGERAQRRTNLVLEVSDLPFPNKRELTPLYKGWRY